MKKALPGLFGLLFIACAPPTQFLKKTYKPSELENKGVVLYPIFADQVSIENDEDFADDFEEVKEDPAQFMRKEINEKAADYFASRFKGIQVMRADDSGLSALNGSNSDKMADRIDKDEFEIRIPKDLYLDSKGLKSKFVLVLDQAIFSRNLEMSRSNMPSAPMMGPDGKMSTGTMSTSTSKKYLAFGINYMIYDYEEKAVVGYGFAKGESIFNFAMTKSDWYKSMDNAFGKVIAFSPFK
jgi:hypothetical protein